MFHRTLPANLAAHLWALYITLIDLAVAILVGEVTHSRALAAAFLILTCAFLNVLYLCVRR